MKYSRLARSAAILLCTACALPFAAVPATASGAVPSRIVAPINAADTVMLAGNVHPLAQPAVDQGRVPGEQQLGHMFIALQRSDDQARELAAFNERQYDPGSADYHHWLQPQEFGQSFGPNDADIAAVTTWLKSAGFEVLHVSPGRISVEFSGTAAQVESALQVQMHRYLVNGRFQTANDRDPQIPRALSPVVAGVSGLNDFSLTSGIVRHTDATASSAASPDLSRSSAGANPDFTMHDGTPLFEFVAPYDFATIYNSLPLWKASTPIIGTGVTIAIVGESDASLSDVAKFRSTFGLPVNAPTIEYVGTNPGGSSFGNTVELEMAGAAAPGAKLLLVVPDGGTNSGGITIGGFLSAIHYIIAKNNANIVSAGYSQCELALGTSNNTMVNSVWQQGATQGMTIFASAGTRGSADCLSSGRLDTFGLQVSGIASSQYVTAVGATDFAWNWIPNGGSIYWNATNTAQHASAKGYVPEYPWNVSCANKLLQENEFLVNGKPKYPYPIDVCNAIENSPTYSSMVTVEGGGGGYSHCTSLNTSGTCESGSGYAKPKWQTGTGVPADGKRDLPDVSLFASAGWPAIPLSTPPTPLVESSMLLGCYSGSGHPCVYGSYSEMIYQATGGPAASGAYWAGILALVEQKHGGTRQGLINPTLYKLWDKESLSTCNTLTVKAGNSCVFYDIAASLSNAQPCKGGSTTACNDASSVSGVDFAIGILSGYESNIGYDQATGLGSVNIENLVDNWSSVAPSPAVSFSSTSLSFGTVAVGSTAAKQTITIKNIANVAVTFTSGGITLTGTKAAEFSKTTTCSSSLAIGGSCTITLSFKPTAPGSASAILSVADNAVVAPQIVSLAGTGG
jgi:subtilase family serine protease